MTAFRGELDIYQGDDFVATVIVRKDGLLVDLAEAGYVARAQIRKDVADRRGEVVAELTTLIEGAFIRLSLTHAETTQLSGRYVWDLQLDLDGQITTILAGGVTVTSEVTR